MHSTTFTESPMAEDMGFGETLRWIVGGVIAALSSALAAVIGYARGLLKARVTPEEMKGQLKTLEEKLQGSDQSIDERRRWLQELVVDPLQRDLKAMSERITNLQQANLAAINATFTPLDQRVRQLEQDMKLLATREDLKDLREEVRRLEK